MKHNQRCGALLPQHWVTVTVVMYVTMKDKRSPNPSLSITVAVNLTWRDLGYHQNLIVSFLGPCATFVKIGRVSFLRNPDNKQTNKTKWKHDLLSGDNKAVNVGHCSLRRLEPPARVQAAQLLWLGEQIWPSCVMSPVIYMGDSCALKLQALISEPRLLLVHN